MEFAFRLTCSVLLWREMDTTNKFHWHVCGVLTLDGPHWVCHSPRQHEFPGSTLLRLQGALQWHCPKWTLCFMYFPDLSRSGSQVFCKGTDPDGLWVLCPSQVQTAQATTCLASALSQMDLASYALPNLGDSVSWVRHEGPVPGVSCISSGELISSCDTPGR